MHDRLFYIRWGRIRLLSPNGMLVVRRVCIYLQLNDFAKLFGFDFSPVKDGYLKRRIGYYNKIHFYSINRYF